MAGVCDHALSIHPTAVCESQHVGEGTRVWAFAHIMDGAEVGRACNIGDHVFIESGARIGDRVVIKNQAMIWDGVTIEDDVFIGPGVIFTNDRHPRSRLCAEARARYADRDRWLRATHVGRGASIGAGSIILCGLAVGRYASVGAGSLVTGDVAAHRLVVGRPARAAGWVCRCGVPLDDTLHCRECGRRLPVDDNPVCPAASE